MIHPPFPIPLFPRPPLSLFPNPFTEVFPMAMLFAAFLVLIMVGAIMDRVQRPRRRPEPPLRRKAPLRDERPLAGSRR